MLLMAIKISSCKRSHPYAVARLRTVTVKPVSKRDKVSLSQLVSLSVNCQRINLRVLFKNSVLKAVNAARACENIFFNTTSFRQLGDSNLSSVVYIHCLLLVKLA